ncbi:MAG: HU family DNA-binding protein [Desulfobacterales bacterium]|nr:HU family DNA-binding protein [Desulfobacterales bacterium]
MQFFKVFGDELALHGRLRLPHYGNFKIVQRKARKGRNPQTGTVIDIPAKIVVKFKAFEKLRSKTCGDNK